MEIPLMRRTLPIALGLLALIWAFRLLIGNTNMHAMENIFPHRWPSGPSEPTGITITDKVAVITETRYSNRLLPLILHFSAVLGPEWPIVLFTSQEVIDQRLGKLWHRAAADGRVEARVVPATFDLTTRHGVNVYLSRPWLWQQLAPARRVLVFQTDAIVCANSGRLVDDFAAWDFIGAPFLERLMNGGLSLRNRTMLLDLLAAGHDWEADVVAGRWEEQRGEDVYFTGLMSTNGATLPDRAAALQFSCEFAPDVQQEKRPFGYHNVLKYAPDSLGEIADWCPEIHLSSVGTLPK